MNKTFPLYAIQKDLQTIYRRVNHFLIHKEKWDLQPHEHTKLTEIRHQLKDMINNIHD